MKKPSYICCSFCGRTERDVEIIPGPEANICVDCVKHAHELISAAEKEAAGAKTPPLPPVPAPKDFLNIRCSDI